MNKGLYEKKEEYLKAMTCGYLSIIDNPEPNEIDETDKAVLYATLCETKLNKKRLKELKEEIIDETDRTDFSIRQMNDEEFKYYLGVIKGDNR